MAVAKWNTPSAQSADISAGTLTSLGAGATSGFCTYDNSTNLDAQASVLVNLGSITPVAGGAILLRVFALQNTDVPDNTGSVGGGDSYVQYLTVSAGAKVVVFPMVRLYPESLRLCITNSAGVAFASSGNTIKVRPFNESVT